MVTPLKTTQFRCLFIQLLVNFYFLVFINANQSCGSRTLSFPFGFSPTNPIRFNCTPQNDVVLGNFQVHSITNDSIFITLKANCSRPIHSIRDLYSNNFAPTARNGLLLKDCKSHKTSTCLIPSTLVKTSFEDHNCRKEDHIHNQATMKNEKISCFSVKPKHKGFIGYKDVMRSGCRSLFSGISTELNDSVVVSLEVQVVELGWWLMGSSCELCDKNNGECRKIVSGFDDGRMGYRCQCRDGFEGDGYTDGQGCRKVSSKCNASKYMSGHCGGVNKLGIFIGVAVAGATTVASIAVFCCVIRRGCRTLMSNRSTHKFSEATSRTCIPVYLYKEIEKATNNFSDENKLGTGAYGTVYLGKLCRHELFVAIKRIKHYEGCVERVLNEINLLSSVEHPNLVRLLGCSIEKGEQILVYEFMPNGTLWEHLQREKGQGLCWSTRLKIVIQTSQAITHLHSIHPPIYHRDIKSSNILLDHNFDCKVADFGLSRLGMPEYSHISTAPQGTPGYLDPQYHQDFQLSDKSDVYSFGVVLAEVITGLKVVDFSREQNEVSLATLATDRIGSNRLFEILDPSLTLELDHQKLSCIHKVGELAFRCLAFHRDMRPSMVEVANELAQISPCGMKLEEQRHVEGLSMETSQGNIKSLNDKTSSFRSKRVRPNSLGYYMMQSKDEFMSSLDLEEEFPVSVQDTWSTVQSSPSSNGLLASMSQST